MQDEGAITPVEGIGLAVSFALLALAIYAFLHALPATADRLPWALTCVVLVALAEIPVALCIVTRRRP